MHIQSHANSFPLNAALPLPFWTLELHSLRHVFPFDTTTFAPSISIVIFNWKRVAELEE